MRRSPASTRSAGAAAAARRWAHVRAAATPSAPRSRPLAWPRASTRPAPAPRERGTLGELRQVLALALDDVGDEPGAVTGAWTTLRPPTAADPEHAAERERVWRDDLGGDEPAPHRADPAAQAGHAGPVWLPRALGAAGAAGLTVWLALTARAPAPVPPAAAGLLAGAAVLLLPRLGWWGLIIALAAVAVSRSLPGAAGVITIALLLPIVLSPMAASIWPLSAGAPALGLIGLAGAWPAVAGRAGTPWRRAALGAIGWVWLLLASAIAGKALYLPLVPGVAPPHAWMRSLSVTVEHLLRPEISAGVLAPALVWALAAVTLPWLVRGGSLVLDVARVVVWATVLVSATGVAVAAWHGSATGPSGLAAPTALLGALASAVVALAPSSTSYSYRVRATDAGNNLSSYSGTTTSVTSVPTLTAPTSLTATSASSTQINLSWTAATETGGTITSYLVERCQTAGCSNFVQVGTSTTTTYNDTGLTGSNSYSYRVRATDAASNLGPYSSTATASTPAATPSAPSNLTATAASSTQVNLSWTVSTEVGGTISKYLVERCQGTGCTTFAQIGTSTSATYADSGLIGSTVYQYRVRAQDSVGTLGPYSSTAAATTAAPVITAPQSLAATVVSAAQINLSWTAATETGGTIGSYLVERCAGASCTSFAQIGTSTTTTYTDTGLSGSTSYSYRVRAKDTAGNTGPYSTTASATTTAPVISAPGSLAATAASSSQINLAWTASTETGGTIASYLVERCTGAACTSFAQVGTSTTTTYSDTGLTASTSYSYRVRAKDAAGNTGPYSTTASATTPSGGSSGSIAFVQVNDAVPANGASVGVPYGAAQTSGNLNVVIVGWNDTVATVSSVTDSKGNTYVRAVGPTVLAAGLTQSIYYAKNIAGAAAGANTVTVQFSTSATYPDIRILEYSGLDVNNPLDSFSAAIGTAVTMDSGAAVTTNANDLLVGANIVLTSTPRQGAGSATA